jgi:hypothetical protein
VVLLKLCKKSTDVMNLDDSGRVFYIFDFFVGIISIASIWLLYLCIIGHVRRKEKTANGETMSGTTSVMSCTGISTIGEEAGVRAGVRAGA